MELDIRRWLFCTLHILSGPAANFCRTFSCLNSSYSIATRTPDCRTQLAHLRLLKKGYNLGSTLTENFRGVRQLTLTDCTQKIFINLVNWWVDHSGDLKTIFERRPAQKVVGNVLTVLHHSSRTLLEELWILRCLCSFFLQLGNQRCALIVVFGLRKLLMSNCLQIMVTFFHFTILNQY